MTKRLKTNIALICAACIVAGLLCGSAAPVSATEVTDGVAVGRESVPVYVDGILTTSCYMDEAREYMSVPDFCEALGMRCTAELPGDWTLSGDFGGVVVSVSADGKYMSANGRYFYLKNGAVTMEGECFLPVAELAKVINADVRWDMATGSIDIDTTNMGVLAGGDSFYEESDLKWLSQIISAESGNQTLEGMLGVGDVVMNRVASELFPDNVHDVVFDTRYGIQFSPVESGGIYNDPSDLAVIAAKICLEGYNVVGDSLYFVNPETGTTKWFRETRTFVVTIGDHEFYA